MLSLVRVRGAPQESLVVLELRVQQVRGWSVWAVPTVWIDHIRGFLIEQNLTHNELPKQLTVEGGRGTAVSGVLGFCKMAGEEGTGGWWESSLGLLGPIFSLASSSPTSPLAL